MAEARIEITLSNGAKAGETLKELSKQANSLNKEIRDLKPGTAEFAAKSKDLKVVEEKMGDIKKQVKGVTEASDVLKQAFNNLPGAQYFNQITQSFGMMKQGVGGLVSQFGVLKTAIAATGIGLLIVALGTLVAWFKKTDEGATTFAGIMRGIGVVFDKVFGQLIDMFKGLQGYFNGEKSIKQGLIDLVEFIGNNLLNRIKSFAVIWEGILNMDFKTVADGFIQLGTGIENGTDKMLEFGKAVGEAVKEGIDLERQLDAIEDKARELSVLNAQTEKEVGRLLLQSKNVGLTYEERIKLLDQASALELANHQQQLANAKELEALRQKEIEDNAKRNIQTDELDQALADAQIARINLEKESITLQEKIANRRTALVEKQQAEIQKQAEEELKVVQNIAALKAQAAEDGFTQEVATIQQQTEEKIANLQGTEAQILEQKLLLKEIEEQQLLAIGEKYQAINNANFKKAKEEEDKINKKALAEREKVAAAEAQLEAFKVETVQETTAGLGELVGSQLKNEKDARKARKAFAVADIGIRLQEELAANAAAGAKISAQAPPYTIPAGIAYTTAANIKAWLRAGIATAKTLLFKRGGYVQGPSHENGGVPGVIKPTGQPIEFEGGEFFFNRKAVQAIGVGALTRINDMFTYATGGSVPSASSSSSSSGLLGFDYQRLAEMFSGMIDQKILRLQVINDVTKTQEGIQVINSITNEADV